MHSSDLPTARDVSPRDAFTKGMFTAYFVYCRDAGPDEEMGLVLAASSKDAVREAMDPMEVVCIAGLANRPGGPSVHDLLDDTLQVVCLRDGRCFVVGSGRWPSHGSVTHAALWSSLDGDVRGRIEAHWASFEKMPGRYDLAPT